MFGSQSRPPLQPPVAHEVGPEFPEKLHSVLPQILPEAQLNGTAKVTVAPEACSHPVGWDGTAVPALRFVNKAGLKGVSANSWYIRVLQPHQIVKGQWFVIVKVLDDCVKAGVNNEAIAMTSAALLRLEE